jgi:hypothetical protein
MTHKRRENSGPLVMVSERRQLVVVGTIPPVVEDRSTRELQAEL